MILKGAMEEKTERAPSLLTCVVCVGVVSPESGEGGACRVVILAEASKAGAKARHCDDGASRKTPWSWPRRREVGGLSPLPDSSRVRRVYLASQTRELPRTRIG